jgi:uncharacterized iron-regulated protein
MTRFLAVIFALPIAACGGGAKYPGPTTPGKSDLPKGGIEAAALPYEVLEGRTGRGVAEPAFWASMVKTRAICIGEEHPNPHHHWVQLHLVRELSKRMDKNAKLGLGLEMFQRPFQGPLDDYAAKRIDAETLRSRSGWAERWGYDWGFYGPTLDTVIAAGGTLLALNAPRELVKKIVRQGIESLTDDEKKQMPELVLDDKNHRAWFDTLMSGMGGTSVHSKKEDKPAPDKAPDKTPTDPAPPPDGTKPHGATNPHNPHGNGQVAMPSAERIYTAQVLWDETMADGSAKWLKANPNGHLVILAGNGHCHDSAIVSRLKRRGVADVVSLRPVIDDGEGAIANVLAQPANDYVIVLKLPKKPPANPPKTALR